MNTKRVHFWHVGTKTEAIKEFAKTIKAKKMYITKFEGEYHIDFWEGGKWANVRYTVEYVTGRDAESLMKKLRGSESDADRKMAKKNAELAEKGMS